MSHYKFRLSIALFKLALLAGTFAAPVSAVCDIEKNEYLQSGHNITEQNLLNDWISNTQLIAGKRGHGGTSGGSSRDSSPGLSSPTSGATSGATSGPASSPSVSVPNDSNKIHHIFGQAKHNWSKTGLDRSGNIELIKKIANEPDNLVDSKMNPNGEVYKYRGSHNELIIEVVVFKKKEGIPTINDAWVK